MTKARKEDKPDKTVKGDKSGKSKPPQVRNVALPEAAIQPSKELSVQTELEAAPDRQRAAAKAAAQPLRQQARAERQEFSDDNDEDYELEEQKDDFTENESDSPEKPPKKRKIQAQPIDLQDELDDLIMASGAGKKGTLAPLSVHRLQLILLCVCRWQCR